MFFFSFPEARLPVSLADLVPGNRLDRLDTLSSLRYIYTLVTLLYRSNTFIGSVSPITFYRVIRTT